MRVLAQVQGNYRQSIKLHDAPSGKSVMNVLRKCEETGSMLDDLKGVTGLRRIERTDEFVQCVEETVQGSRFFVSAPWY